ncbi:phospholipase A2 inhibitor and Ly6/PLAUR domain-containing protein [Alligator mississippiensis]|nr:phospholipase A2 inhibitor and Ly6/PLAUR domain-containing protein [Alligator mississippiensis]
MKSPLTLNLFSALLTVTGAQIIRENSLSCFYCKSGGRCSHVPQVCRSTQDACIFVSEHNTLGAESTGTYQSCTDSKKSFTGFVGLYFGEATMVEIKSEICNTDDCNAQLTWSNSAINGVPNGLHCPTCYAPGFSTCESTGNLRCKGGADQCIYAVGKISQGGVAIPFAAHGCATQTACHLTTLEAGVFTYNLTRQDCSPAPRAPASGSLWVTGCAPLFLPSLFVLLLH